MDVHGNQPQDNSIKPLAPIEKGLKVTKQDSNNEIIETLDNQLLNQANARFSPSRVENISLGATQKVYQQVDKVRSVRAVTMLEGQLECTDRISYADANTILMESGLREKDGRISLHQWEINFALLDSACRLTTDKGLKLKIRFLMNNYLQKSAYFNGFAKKIGSGTLQERYIEMLQYGKMTLGGQYHRTSDSMTHHLDLLEYDRKFGVDDSIDNYIPLDTVEIDHLYHLNFHPVMDVEQEGAIEDAYVEQFAKEGQNFSEPMKVPILLDISREMGDAFFTNRDQAKVEEYKGKVNLIKNKLLKKIELSIKRIKKQNPSLNLGADELRMYLLSNTVIVSKATLPNGLSVLSFYKDFFSSADFNNGSLENNPIKEKSINKIKRKGNELMQNKIFSWSNHTGIALGAIRFREEYAKTNFDAEDLDMEVFETGNSEFMIYKSPMDVLTSREFEQFQRVSKNPLLFGAGQSVLASGTEKMIKTLFGNLTKEKWTEVQNNPAIKKVIQTAIGRMMDHLRSCNFHIKNFRKYSQAIDRVHAELTAVLLFMKPFEEGTFEEYYGDYVKQVLPRNVEISSIGVGKSAMNIYSAVNAAIIKTNANPVRAFGEHSYYEEAELFGHTKLDDVLMDPSVEKVDIFTAEFYHNIDVTEHEMRYKRENVITSIKKIFKKKPATDALTVVIDGTLDLTKSKDHKLLFDSFKKEIKEGRINFVMIKSGQKYDMLGLDNYFGAPFYVVNNKSSKWQNFNNIKYQKAHQTDPLSNQYFSWMAASSPKIMDDYKKQIYKNTRAILNAVPPGLWPKNQREVIISQMDLGVSTPFFEIAVKFDDYRKEDKLMIWMHKKFTEIFVSNDKLFYQRGSFGFAHPNFTEIEGKIRINPGLDPNETVLYREFFAKLEAKVKQLKKA